MRGAPAAGSGTSRAGKLNLSCVRTQLWRLVTCFLYWGPLSLDFFFHLFFLCVLSTSSLSRTSVKLISMMSDSMRYSKMLEQSSFHGRRADYVWLLIVSCTMLLVSAARSIRLTLRETMLM